MYKSENFSRKTRVLCFLKGNQAENHKPEADWRVEKGKVCIKARIEVRKHTVCVFEEKSRQKKPMPEADSK